MTARLAAASAQLSMGSPPSYENSTGVGLPIGVPLQDTISPSFRYFDLDNAFHITDLGMPERDLRHTTVVDGLSFHMIVNLVIAVLLTLYAMYTTCDGDYVYPHD